MCPFLASRREERHGEIRLRILRLFAENPEISTRELAAAVGISNGSAHYVVTALLGKGLIKLSNFAKNPRKTPYAYLLTPKGIREKSLLTHSFIERKREEFEVLQAEIKALEEEAGLAAEATRQAGTHEVSATAITRLGNFMRKTKIDELPQLVNILRNEVSLIGPRPCLQVQEELIAARNAHGVLTIKPGISGLAQVNNIDMSDPQKLARWDARYVGLRSLFLDLKITIATATGRGQGDRTSPKI